MGKKPEVSLEKRAEINVLLSEGLSQKEIAAKLEISQSAVSKIIKRIIEFGTYTPKPRPGRPRVRFGNKARQYKKGTSNLKVNVNDMCDTESLDPLDDSHNAIEEDNFFLSLCEIDSTIRNEVESYNESENLDSEYEKVSYMAMKQEKPDIRPSFDMDEIPNFIDVNNSEDDKSSIFMEVEGRKKIKSEFKRPSDFMGFEENNYNSTRVENQNIHIKTEDKRPRIYIKPEIKLRSAFRLEEEVIPHRNIKKERNFYEENDDYHNVDDDDESSNFEYTNYEDSDENNFYNINYQSNNKMSYNNARGECDDNNQHFYPDFSKSRPSQSKKKTGGYFRIYDKSIKRRPRKGDIQIKPTTFVKISERKRIHEKRSGFKSTSPLKIRFQKEQF